jgi:exopolysaccharide biosynthesis polyprenyl glycosylphosphotransferase
LVGKIQDIPDIIEQYKISNIIIALPIDEQTKVKKMINELQTFAIQIYVIPDYIQFALYNTKVETLDGTPLLDLRASSITDYERLIKRVTDLFITTLALPITLPIMIFIAIITWIDDGLPILYFQKRVGENGKVFTMVKFRTMKNSTQFKQNSKKGFQTEENFDKIPDDPRITKVGKILRHFSLDELPQMFNVLKGEMSLVGPRPELPSFVDKYELWQRARFTVPQGITGWWQVNGRSDNPMYLNTEYDLYYIQNYSIWLDFYIFFKTIPVVISGKGAF